jgi:hypothetical protein
MATEKKNIKRGKRFDLTFHKNLFDYLAQLLHYGLGQIVALFRFFQPLVQPGAGAEIGGAWLGNDCHLHLRKM